MTTFKTKLGTTKAALLCVAAGYLIWGAAAVIFLAMPVFDVVKFLIFQIAAVALPGFAAYKLFNLKLSPLEALTVSYGLGIAALCALYFCFAPFKAMAYIKYGVLALALASAVVLYLKRNVRLSSSERRDDGEMKIALIFCAFAAVATFVTLSAANLNPSITGARAFYHDITYGASLCASAAKGFPMQSLQLSGVNLSYHILYFSYGAIIKLCTDIPAFETVMNLTLITISPLIAAAFVCFAKRILKKNLFVCLSSVLALVIPEYVLVYYIYQDTIGYPMGLAFALVSALLFFEAEALDKSVINRYHFVSLIFLLVCLGSKGPVAVTILFGFCFYLLMKLIRKKDWSVIPTGLFFAVPFAVIYFLLYSGKAGSSISLSFFYSAIRTDFAYSIYEKFPDFIFKTLCCLYYTFTFNSLISVALLLLLLYVILAKKKTTPFLDFTFGGLILGLVFINILKQSGSSEIYFLLIMAPFAAIAAVFCAIEIYNIGSKKHQRLISCSLFSGLLLIVALVSIPAARVSYFDDYKDFPGRLNAAAEFSRFNPDKASKIQELPVSEPALRVAITSKEYEGLLWLRDNAPKGSIVVDSRYLLSSQNFNGSAFSELTFYLEGVGYVTHDASSELAKELLRRESTLHFLFDYRDDSVCVILSSEGCDYIVVNEYITPGFTISEKYGTLVFENSDVRIYELVKYGV